MKILVTGGAGFIGSNIVDSLIESGHKVIVVDDLSSGKRENINKEAEFYHLEIGDPKVEEIFKNNKIDIIDHHAAQMDVRKSVLDPIFDAKTNILDAIKILQYASKYGVKKIVYASTGGAVYGEPEYLPADEKHPVRPKAPYGISKYSFEKYIEYFSDMYGLDYTILRYANVYGPRQDPHGEAGVVAIFSGLLLDGKDCRIFGDGSQERDYVYVGDVVKANMSAIEKGSGEIVNIGTGVGTSVTDLYSKMIGIMGINKPAVHEPERPGEVSRVYLKNDKAKQVLGWKPSLTLEAGLAKTIEFFREKRKKTANIS